MDAGILALSTQKQRWAEMPVPEKIQLFESLIPKVVEHAETWVNSSVAAKRIPMDSPLVGEEWLSGPWATLYGIQRAIRTLKLIVNSNYPNSLDLPSRVLSNKHLAVQVFPNTLYDRLLLSGISAEVWMQEGVTSDNLHEYTASFYKEKNPRGKVALVLGAGNIASIAPLDVLYKMFAEGQICVLKMNPVNDYLGPIFEQIFSRFISQDLLRLAYGGVEVGEYLTAHPEIEEIHITGSAKTHDAIVFGTGTSGKQRKAAGQRRNTKRITSELGNVSPTIVLPGPWSKADFRFQAENIATQKLHNAGFNCIASQVLVLPMTWSGSETLKQQIGQTFEKLKPRHGYYPGHTDRVKNAIDSVEKQQLLLSSPAAQFITDFSSTDKEHPLFTEESFAPVLVQTSIDGDLDQYLDAVVDFCNNTLAGTLGCNLLIHPKTIRELGPKLEQLLTRLCYGTIGVNLWQGAGFLLAEGTWGAYPGHTIHEVESGIGVVHNAYLFEKPEKTVLRGSFHPFPRGLLNGVFTTLPKPPWFVTHKRAADVGRKLVAFEANPSLFHLPGIFYSALLG